jgi:hypothetical protein
MRLYKESAQKDGAKDPTKNAKFWHQHLRSEKGLPSPALSKGPMMAAIVGDLTNKITKAKINTGLRSTSSVGKFRGVTKSPT